MFIYRTISEQWTEKNVEGSGRGAIWRTTPVSAWKDCHYIPCTVSGPEMWNWDHSQAGVTPAAPCRPQPLHSRAYAESESACPHAPALRNRYVTLFHRVTSCSLVRTDVLNKRGGKLPSGWKQQVRLKRRCMSTKLHGITFLKAVFAVTVAGIRNLTRKN